MDLSKLSDEQLEAYRYLLERRQTEQHPPGVPPAPIPEELQPDKPESTLKSIAMTPVRGGQQLAHGVEALANKRYAAGTADAIEGAGKMASPLLIPAAIANPIGTAAALGGGMIGQKGGEMAAEHFGASPDTARLVGDIASIPIGGLAAKGATALGKTVAPALAESALGVRGKQRQFGAEPGKAALRETKGFSPQTVEESAGERIGQLTPVMEAHTEQAPPVSLSPSRGLARGARSLQANQGNLSAYNDLGTLEESLAGNRVTGEQYPETVPARKALDIKRGIGQEQGDFNRQPGRTAPATSAARNVYGQLARDIHEAAPAAGELDDRISSLIPVRDRAKIAGLGASPTERVVDRATRPTGGFLPAIFGFHAGGLKGMAEALGGQELLASPTAKMAMARGLWRGVGGERLGVPEMPQVPPARGLLGSGPIVTAPPEDTSFVRGAPGMTAPPNPARALPSASTRFSGPAPDQSSVRGVPASAPFRVGFAQRALPAASASVANPEIGSQHGDIIGQPQSPYRRPLTMREIQQLEE